MPDSTIVGRHVKRGADERARDAADEERAHSRVYYSGCPDVYTTVMCVGHQCRPGKHARAEP